MKFRLPIMLLLAALFFALVASPVAAQIADGTYQVNYQVKHESKEDASIADGYFQKPATLTVKNGSMTVTMKVTGKQYIQSLTAPSGPVNVVSEDSDSMTVSFPVGDLSKPLYMDMHIKVPEMYDVTHTARFIFNTDGLPEAGSNADSNANTGNATGEKVENPKTGEDTSIALYVTLLVASLIGLVAIWKFKPARN